MSRPACVQLLGSFSSGLELTGYLPATDDFYITTEHSVTALDEQ